MNHLSKEEQKAENIKKALDEASRLSPEQFQSMISKFEKEEQERKAYYNMILRSLHKACQK